MSNGGLYLDFVLKTYLMNHIKLTAVLYVYHYLQIDLQTRDVRRYDWIKISSKK